jgi:hypothetical protein
MHACLAQHTTRNKQVNKMLASCKNCAILQLLFKQRGIRIMLENAKISVSYANTLITQVQRADDRAMRAALQKQLTLKEALAKFANTATEDKGVSAYKIRKFYKLGWHMRGNCAQFCKVRTVGERAGTLELWYEY